MILMRRKAFILTLALISLGLIFTGCSQEVSSNSPEGDELTVFTTIYPVHYFTSEIVGNKGKVISLIPAGSEPHHWEPSPGDLVKLNNADALVYNGAGMEYWLRDVLKALEKNVKAIDCSKGIDLLEVKSGRQENGALEARVDPHIWLDPVNAIVMVENITRGLSEIDPDNAQYFKEQRDLLVEKLTELDKEFSQTLKELDKRQIVVSHAAFGYMARRYGLEQIPVRGLSAEVEPGPARLAEIVKTIRDREIGCVFFESLVSPKVSETIAREAGVKVLELNPLGGLSVEDEKNGENYFSLMRKNLAHLKEGLGTKNE